jgi:hypothetical protein
MSYAPYTWQGLEVLRSGDRVIIDLVKILNNSRPGASIACIYQSLDKPANVSSGPKPILTTLTTLTVPDLYLGRFHGRRKV